MLIHLLLFCSLVGLISCTVFLGLLTVASRRFKRANENAGATPDALPRVSILKPVHGLEPELERSLESFFLQDYLSYEIVFGCRYEGDPALRVVNILRERHPNVPVKVVLSGEPDRPNAKVCSLERMVQAAETDYLIISDSDVHVAPDYLRAVVAPLLDPKVGLVTCLYRGVATGGFWSRLEALGMSVELTSGVIIANMLEGMKFALGPTMATRRDVLAAIGGVGVLADYHADDYVLGEKVDEAGYKVVLSQHIVEHIVLNRRFLDSFRHQVRWTKSTRFSRPKGHIGAGLTFATPFGIIAAICCMILNAPIWAAALLGWALLSRMLQAIVAGWKTVGDRESMAYCWLYPARDFLGFILWSASFMGSTFFWRGERYRFQAGGRIVCDVPRTDSPLSEAAGD
jgi:ceramide glucosyltransferase